MWESKRGGVAMSALADSSRVRVLAAHEAGHALAGHAAGCYFRRVTIDPRVIGDRPNVLGFTEFDPLLETGTEPGAIRDPQVVLRIALAGALACKVVTGHHHWNDAKDDIGKAAHVAAHPLDGPLPPLLNPETIRDVIKTRLQTGTLSLSGDLARDAQIRDIARCAVATRAWLRTDVVRVDLLAVTHALAAALTLSYDEFRDVLRTHKPTESV